MAKWLQQSKPRKVVNLGKITNLDLIPDLIDIQFKSYEWFLQKELAPNKRARQ